ncbi:MAG: LytTR family DNA-binding domain-containing protein [Bacteroidota bacterium]|nr:LytTR family DNA-binding domain-containing protein [Bacteroidota bacterium]
MRRFYHTLFWILTFVILTLTFGRSYGGLAKSFYFVAFLFPIIVGTSYLVTSYLVPRFLLKKAYFKFVLYFIYTLVFSVYLEMLVITLSLIVFANFEYSELNPKTTDIVFLTVVLYFLVFLNTLVFLIQEYFRGEEKQRELETEKEKLTRGYLVVRSERKNSNLPYDQIEYVESLGNYVRILTSEGEPVLTREKISSLKEKLPGSFLRIHRSILVNRDKIQSFSKEMILVNEVELPLSRKYKEEVLRILMVKNADQR